MLRCPKCQSSEIHRTPTSSKWARLRRRLTSKRPHLCETCGWRGWGEETGPKFTPEQIELASRAFDEPLDVAQQLEALGLPHESEYPSPLLELPPALAHDTPSDRDREVTFRLEIDGPVDRVPDEFIALDTDLARG